MIDEGEDPGPDDSLILFGLDSIRVMEFVALLEQHGPAAGRASNQPSATATTAASG